MAEAHHRHHGGFPEPPPDADGNLIDRELSRLDFDARVLAQAEDPSLPILERVKFLAILSSNLDEFFQIRVAGIKGRQAAGLGPGPGTGTPTEQLQAIRTHVSHLVARQSHHLRQSILPALEQAGIMLSDWGRLDDSQRAYVHGLYEERIFPVLTPLAVDPGHPFPYISDLSLNLAVFVRSPQDDRSRFARVKVPPLLPRFIALPGDRVFVPLESVIAAHLPSLFPGLAVEEQCMFRVTRNLDLHATDDEEADDLLALVEMDLRRRRFGEAVRLEVDAAASDRVLELLLPELGLDSQDVYRVDAPLDLSGLWSLHGLKRPDLKDAPWRPITPALLERPDGEPADVFQVVRARDVLVHHPYEPFSTTVEEFIRQASTDPAVMAIKMSLYRTSGDSPIIKALIRAAERGKQVAALVELQARGDEQANIAWARTLEEAGVHVVYGLMGLKTHCKTTLVVRQDDDGIRRYCHLGTGNYNPSTARTYEDIGLLTADPDLGADLTELFNYLTGYSRRTSYRKILVSPLNVRSALVSLIDEQITLGAAGRVVLKVNNLVDPDLIEALYLASQAGVSVDLIVRTMCSLRPGVRGLSDNIRVRSVLGRYLEHSRIFAFGTGASTRYLIGSADMMERNLDRRVEVLTPVEQVDLRDRLRAVLDVLLDPGSGHWSLGPDGRWTPHAGFDPQGVFAQSVAEAHEAGLAARGSMGVVRTF